MYQLPNILTWLRLLMAPVLVILFLTVQADWRDVAATLCFTVAMLTDFFDGYLARRLNSSSRFGEFLDPIADKIIVIAALLLLLDAGRVPVVAVLILIGREICILGLREWLAELGQARRVSPSLSGKTKTVLQMVAIFLLLYQEDIFSLPTLFIGQICLWLATVLSVISMIVYLRIAWRKDAA